MNQAGPIVLNLYVLINNGNLNNKQDTFILRKDAISL